MNLRERTEKLHTEILESGIHDDWRVLILEFAREIRNETLDDVVLKLLKHNDGCYSEEIQIVRAIRYGNENLGEER